MAKRGRESEKILDKRARTTGLCFSLKMLKLALEKKKNQRPGIKKKKKNESGLKCRHRRFKKRPQMRDSCARLWCHFKGFSLRKWANIALIQRLACLCDCGHGVWGPASTRSMNRGLHRGRGMRGGGEGGRGGHVSDFFVTQGSSLLSPSVIGSSFSHARERWPPLNSLQ